MVAVINFSSSLSNVLNYNENKLKQEIEVVNENGRKEKIKKAEFFHSSGYAKDTDQLGFTDKLKRLQMQMALRPSRKQSVIHISLNFDPSEKKKLAKNILKEIADTYMEKIGFAKQPYLVYQHNDAGHPHIHIVSTIIQNSGVPIETHKLAALISEPARKEIELLYGLVKADEHKQKEILEIRPVNVQKAQIGKSETKRAITNVLDAVLTTYKYTSLNELNAILKQYNVMADGGQEDSRIHRHKGLVYRILDEAGNKVSAPIKSSALYNKPGLKYLQDRFEKNFELRKPYRQKIKNTIDLALSKPSVQKLEDLQQTLQRDKIQVVIRENKEGRISGLTFIDHHSKSIFKGSDIGKQYSANAILERINQRLPTISQEIVPQEKTPVQRDAPRLSDSKQVQIPKSGMKSLTAENKFVVETPTGKDNVDLIKELIKPEYQNVSVPSELKRKRKRKRKRIHL